MYQYWFVWWMRVCVLFLCLEDMFKPTATASHSHRRKVQLRRQWDGTEDNSPITPSLLHKTHTDDMECIDHSYWREITVHHLIIIITRFFSPYFLCESFEKILTVSVGVVVTVWVKISGKFSSLTMRSVLSARPPNTSSNLLLLSKPTWKLEHRN